MENKGNKSGSFILLLLFVILAAAALIHSVSLRADRSGGYSDPVVSSKNVRGTVYDRHGNLVAFDTVTYGLMILDEDKAQMAASEIAGFTSFSPVEITSAFDKGTSFFPLSGEGAERRKEAGEYLLKNNLIGTVILTAKRTRSCPYSSLSSIIGTSEKINEGEGGIEELFNSYLSSSPTLYTDAVYGEDLVLTIDKDYQEILASALREAGYKGNAAILNRRGEIIAWYGDVSEELLRNICYSHSTKEATVLFDREDYIFTEECEEVSSFYVWLSYPDEKGLSSIRKALGD